MIDKPSEGLDKWFFVLGNVILLQQQRKNTNTMKKLITFTVLMALTISGFAQILNFDFSAECDSGQTLYYRITSEVEHTVTLTYPYSEENPDFWCNYYASFVIPQGDVIIPSVVTYNGINYSVTAIDANTFWDCDITSAYIPNSVSIIEPRAFASCESLYSLLVDETNPVFYSDSNAIIRRADKALVAGCKTTTIPDDVEIICNRAFYAASDGGNLIVPNSVKTIEEWAFAFCEFSGTITLSEGLETIEPFAFNQSRFSGSLTIPNSVTEIGNNAFQLCGRLTGNLTISTSLTTINDCAFASPFTGTLIIPNSVEHIGAHAFNSSFDEIHSPNTTPPTLGSYAFYQCDASTPIHIPFGCTEIYRNATGWNYFNNFIEEEPIIYTIFEPDTCFTLQYPDTIYWDLNQDGTDDIYFYLVWHSAGGYMTYMKPLANWKWSNSVRVDQNFWQPLTDTTMIDESLIWTSGYSFINEYETPEWWHFAFRHQAEDGIHYGWMHFSNIGYCSCCISSMGYCTLPDQPIQWGQTGFLSVEENKETNGNAFVIYPNPTNGILFVETQGRATLPDQTYCITNIMGQTLRQGTITEETQQINIESLPAGMYFINVSDISQKFVKQ